MIQQGTIKFVNNKGYGFAKGGEADVYLHVKGYRMPYMEAAVYPNVPGIGYEQGQDEIDPNDFSKGDEITMEVETGPKGLMAKRWWYTRSEDTVKQRINELRVYKLIVRYVHQGEPYGNQEQRCWMVDRSLRETDVFTGYMAQMHHYHRPMDAQVKVFVKDGDRWVPIPCPIGDHNGGSLFNLPPNWAESVRVAG